MPVPILPDDAHSCCPGSGCAPTRRDALKTMVAGVPGLLALGAATESGAPESPPSDDIPGTGIPLEKNLDPGWVARLREPGGPGLDAIDERGRSHVGMPVGGIGCGTLYVGGDGRLWNWDLFNRNAEGVLARTVPWSEVAGGRWTFDRSGTPIRPRDGAEYVRPPTPADEKDAVAHDLVVTVAGASRRLRAEDWDDVRFEGRYPVALVRYRSAAAPIEVDLRVFTPWSPLDLEDSSLPVTIREITIRSKAGTALEVVVTARIENACCRGVPAEAGRRRTLVTGRDETPILAMDFVAATRPGDPRPDLVVEDFEAPTWEALGARASGTAFGAGPIARGEVPPYQGDLGLVGERGANSHASAPGSTIPDKDAATGRLRLRDFVIERRYLRFRLGGGRHPGRTGIRLVVGDRVVREETGHDANRLRNVVWSVAEFERAPAHLEIVDEVSGPWGNIGVDHVVQSDDPGAETELRARGDFGTMALALAHPGRGFAREEVARRPGSGVGDTTAEFAPDEVALSALETGFTLSPGAEETVPVLLAWHFPNVGLGNGPDGRSLGRAHFAARFADAEAVLREVLARYPELVGATTQWVRTWYDATLPRWFLDRAMAPTVTLATSTCRRFEDGRFYAFEGVGCCEGTCTHVWHYAQAPGRLFPELERDHRERVDFGAGFDEASGMIRHRGEGSGPAVDGQAGRILAVWREHTMQKDDAFLRRIWPRVRRATEWLLAHDADGDGLLDGAQENTLDAAWFGKIAWLSGLALAAVRAAEEMAEETGDETFRDRCSAFVGKGKAAIERELWVRDGYFIQSPLDPAKRPLGTYEGCHIDQVLGEAWLVQAGLPPVLDPAKTKAALASLYRFNFAPDVGPFRERNPLGRAYALPGEAGLVMVSNPRRRPKPYGDVLGWQYGYFNECMSGFEHQAAAHMMAVGLVTEGLAVFRAIHERYDPRKRNPYNEVECSDHYARAMAAFGALVAIGGIAYHGPKQRLRIDPKLPGRYRTPWVFAEGFGTLELDPGGERPFRVTLAAGQATLREILLPRSAPPPGRPLGARLGSAAIALTTTEDTLLLRCLLPKSTTITTDTPFEIVAL